MSTRRALAFTRLPEFWFWGNFSSRGTRMVSSVEEELRGFLAMPAQALAMVRSNHNQGIIDKLRVRRTAISFPTVASAAAIERL